MKSIIVSVVGLVALTFSALNGHAQLNVEADGNVNIGSNKKITLEASSTDVNNHQEFKNGNGLIGTIGSNVTDWQFKIGTASGYWSVVNHDTSDSLLRISNEGIFTGGSLPGAVTNGTGTGFAVDGDGAINFVKNTGGTAAFIRFYNGAGLAGFQGVKSNNEMYIHSKSAIYYELGAAGNVWKLEGDNFYCDADNFASIGRADRKFKAIHAYSCSGTSDRRLKKEIAPMSLGLDFVLSLRPTTFKWKESSIDDETHYGFIAQEFQDSMKKFAPKKPGVVTYHEDSDVYSVRYAEITAINTKAIQELSAKVDSLKNRNTDLTNKNKNLKKQLSDEKASRVAMLKRLERLERLALSRTSEDVALNNQAMQPVAGENK